jgi:hypothetical protein
LPENVTTMAGQVWILWTCFGRTDFSYKNIPRTNKNIFTS